MKTSRRLAAALTGLGLALGLLGSGHAAEKTRLLVVSGGHDFQTNLFFKVFAANPDVTFEKVTHPAAHAKLRPEAASAFDVLVLYDLWQPITDEAKADLLAFLKAGKGLLVLHHAIANYQSWPEYEKIIGGRYYLAKTLVNGVEKAQSTYQHDVDFPVKIADLDHPVTRGLKDFTIHDETYGLFDMGTNSHLLLTADVPTSAKNIGWCKTYGPARVVYLQLGHDHQSWDNPSYRQLLAQALRWVAKKD